ncbi:MAG: hypothetical protein K2H07_06865, partial [Lachnospiraceae bacterium]|nr:hypothetical protein [Lachnospiraceae bacterium]
MKRKTKMMISALSAMLLMVLAVTIVSFSLAGNNDESEVFDDPLLYAEGDQTEKTNIDYIIENSYVTEDNVGEDEADGSEGDPYYRIVEIGSGSASALQTMCNGDVSAFAEYVINGNKTIEQDMKEKTIVYSYYNASTITKDSPELETIARADFIYVSCDPTNQYTVTNDLGEDLYNFLKNTYLTQRKPLVIDSPEKTKELAGETQGNKVSMSKLATDVFATKGSRYYTFAWDKSKQTAEQFLRHQNGSLYLGINGSRKTGNWTATYLYNNETRFNAAKMLVISPKPALANDSEYITADAYPMAHAFLATDAGNGNDVSGGGDYRITVDDEEGNAIKVYGIAPQILGVYGYNGKYVTPNHMMVDTYQLQTATADELLDYDFDKYDMIVIEDGLGSVQISPELYRKFSAAMIGNVTIVYGSDMVVSGSGSGSGNTEVDTKSTNYRELFYTVANSKDVPTRTNVMVTNRQEFEAIATSNNAETCKV